MPTACETSAILRTLGEDQPEPARRSRQHPFACAVGMLLFVGCCWGWVGWIVELNDGFVDLNFGEVLCWCKAVLRGGGEPAVSWRMTLNYLDERSMKGTVKALLIKQVREG